MFNNKEKKAIVSIVTFSLIIIIMILVMIFSQEYYSTSKEAFGVKIKNQEVLNSISMFRSSLVDLSAKGGSYLNYSSSLDDVGIEINLRDKLINGYFIYEENVINVTISTLGVEFCSNYSFNPNYETVFFYNGTCISKYS